MKNSNYTTRDIHPLLNKIKCLWHLLTHKEFIIILIEGKGKETSISTYRRTDRSDKTDADITRISSDIQYEILDEKNMKNEQLEEYLQGVKDSIGFFIANKEGSGSGDSEHLEFYASGWDFAKEALKDAGILSEIKRLRDGSQGNKEAIKELDKHLMFVKDEMAKFERVIQCESLLHQKLMKEALDTTPQTCQNCKFWNQTSDERGFCMKVKGFGFGSVNLLERTLESKGLSNEDIEEVKNEVLGGIRTDYDFGCINFSKH